MASGLAIIATNVGAVAAMVSSENGWLIEPANKDQLEAALNNAIVSKELVSKKERSLELVRSTFNWDIIAQKTLAAIAHK
jgi:glycosyltransferase involved in cell wall biosynthesis